MTKSEKTLALLHGAGAEGLSSSALTALVSHRFGSAISDLRKAGCEIDTVRRSDGLHYYTLLNPLPDPAKGVSNALQRSDGVSEPLSVRRAWQFIANQLREGTAEAYAAVVELIRRQPELLTSKSVRHNLGARKGALLDRLA